MNNTYHIASSCQQFGFQMCDPTSEILDRGSWYPTEDLSLDSLQIPQEKERDRKISRSLADSLRYGVAHLKFRYHCSILLMFTDNNSFLPPS